MNDATRPPCQPGFWTTLIVFIVISALLAALLFFRVADFFGSAGNHVDRLVRDAFLSAAHLQPRVVVNERVVFEQTSPTLELSTAQRDVTVERKLEDTWLGSTKSVRLRGVYRVKAGFDLRQAFDVRINNAGTIAARLPAARLLSVEQLSLETLDFQNGVWNRVDGEEIKAEVNALNTEARLKAIDAGLPRDAESELERQIRLKLGSGHPISISYSPTAAASPTPLP